MEAQEVNEMPPTADAVREQYEEFPFPEVNPADETWRLQIMPQDSLLAISHFCFAGRRDLREGCRVLVAGGGTGHSTVFLAEQLRGTNSEIVHVDVSAAAIDVARQRVAQRGLENVQFVRASLLDAPDLRLGTFDYVNCTGVLHHLEDPSAGLAALAAMLDPSGAMGLMVYGAYGRRHVYLVQELVRRLRKPEDTNETRIECALAVLEALPPWFFASLGIHQDGHVEAYRKAPTNVVDTYLHAQDRAYTVDEIYELVEGAGLCFNGFTSFQSTMGGRQVRNPLHFLENPDLRARVEGLSAREQAAVAEMVFPRTDLHAFYVSFRNPTVASADDDELVPEVSGLQLAGSPIFERFDGPTIASFLRQHTATGGFSNVRHPIGRPTVLSNDTVTAALIEGIDGVRTTGEICKRARSITDASHREVRERWTALVDNLAEIDWVLLRHRDIPPYASYETMQARVGGTPEPA